MLSARPPEADTQSTSYSVLIIIADIYSRRLSPYSPEVVSLNLDVYDA